MGGVWFLGLSSAVSLAIGGSKRGLGHISILHHSQHHPDHNIHHRRHMHMRERLDEKQTLLPPLTPPTRALAAPSFSSLASKLAARGNGNGNDELFSDIEEGADGGSATKSSTKIVVVGAGISGLSVAYHLLKLSRSSAELRPNLDIEILEVRDRIGGRIEPFKIDDGASNRNGSTTTATTASTAHEETWIDLGGQWVHEASPENPIRRLMEDDLNLGFVGDDEKEMDVDTDEDVAIKPPNRFHAKRLHNVLFDPDGNLVDRGILQRARTVFYKAVADLDDAVERDGNLGNARRNKISFRDLLEARTELEVRSDRRLLAPTAKKAFDAAMNYFVHRSEENEGGKLREVSAVLANHLYEGHGGAPDRVVKGSYKSLLEALSSELGLDEDCDSDSDCDPDCDTRVWLRSGARVERIDYDYCNSSRNNNNNINNNNDSGDKRISLSVVEHEMLPRDGVHSGDGKASTRSATAAAVGSSSTTTTTSVLECDYCVCTVPLGVLQQRKIEFVPPLPEKRQEAIDGIGMGLLNKIVFRFDFEHAPDKKKNSSMNHNDNEFGNSYKFWGDLKQFGICHEDPSLVKTYYDCTDDYYDRSRNHKSAILVQFLAGEAADRVDPPLPLRAAMESCEEGDIDGNINCSSSNSNSNRGLTDEEAIHESLEALRSVFGEENVPKPSVSKVTRWRKDPWSCGSYSFARVGSAPGMYDEIASPLGDSSGGSKSKNKSNNPNPNHSKNNNNNSNNNNGRLLFAGEHTSKHFHSTVHGAWETGAREANRIFDQLQRDR